MTLARNLLLFLVLFLPASCATGLVGGFLHGPLPPPRIGYEIGLFLFPVLPLLLPSVLAVPILHFAYRAWSRRRSPREARLLAAGLTPLALLGVHLTWYGTFLWSVPLVALFVVPGVLYGLLFGIPRAAPLAEGPRR